MDSNHTPANAYTNQPVPAQDVSAYNTVAVINEPHQIYLVQHKTTGKIRVKKILDVYNINIYARLYHDHITGTPEIISYEESDGKLTVIEEYVAGTSLQEKIAACTLTEIDILSYMIDICTILEQLHGFVPPIVHRDVKPSNVIITEYNRAVLLDFNAAKYYSSDTSEDTVLLGTQGYASPEQYGFGASTPQSDIYSLGVMLKEMMSSVQLSNLELTAIANKCTQMIPAERYPDVITLKKNLNHYLRRILRRYTSDATLRITNARNPVERRVLPDLPDLREYALPGFRTGTPRNIMIASVTYSLMGLICAASTFSDVRGPGEQWFYRISSFLMMLTVVFAIFNYRDIWRFMPLCKSKNTLIQVAGIAILVFLLLFIWLCLFFVIKEIVFS